LRVWGAKTLDSRNQLALSIVVVNWHAAKYLQRCLESVYENSHDLDFDVVVIDNGSYDGCCEMLRREFPDVWFIQSDVNLGFSGANNRAFAESRGRNILFLNPDTEMGEGAVNQMLAALEGSSDAGIVGPRLLNSDGSIQTSCIQRFPSVLNQLFDATVLRRAFPGWRIWGMQPLISRGNDAIAVEAVSGACLLIRREVFEACGMFSTAYFMYAEDIDLCYMAHRLGWKSYFVPSATVIHYGGRSSGESERNNFAAVMMRESLARFMRRHHGQLYSCMYRFAMGIAAVMRVSALGSTLVLTFGRFHRDTLQRALYKWTSIFRWAVGVERWPNHLSTANEQRHAQQAVGEASR